MIAAAVPDGNGRRSRLISWRLSGIARVTPSAATQAIHAASAAQCGWTPVGAAADTESSSIAGNTPTTMLPVAYAADDAVDCMQLASSTLSGLRAMPSEASSRHSANDARHAASAMLKNHPVLRPM